MGAETWFLVIADYTRNGNTSVNRFSNGDIAAVAYAKAEERHRKDTDIEVLLVATDSEESLRTNYRHMFQAKRTDTVTALAQLRSSIMATRIPRSA
ncbi:hypothetical protein [Stackebrandtia soli]|uniref:hypothetical protein n=1 Tax=Stackebrandtia soli TaxID=1892856 RepID=UPI0039E85A01